MAKIFSNFIKTINPESQKKTTPINITIKQLKTKDKEGNLKATGQGKGDLKKDTIGAEEQR